MVEREARGSQDFSNKRLTKLGINTLRRYEELLEIYNLSPVIYKKNPWLRVASTLRNYPRVHQQEIALDFFDKEAKFPNGKELADFLVRINNIDWFRPNNPPNQAGLQQKVNQMTEEFHTSPKRSSLIHDDWELIRIKGLNNHLDKKIKDNINTFKSLAKETGRSAAMSVAMDAAEGCTDVAYQLAQQLTSNNSNIAYQAAKGAAKRVGELAKMGAGWIIIKDQEELINEPDLNIPINNPTNYLFDIYQTGGVPIGPDGSNYLIFWPKIQPELRSF